MPGHPGPLGERGPSGPVGPTVRTEGLIVSLVIPFFLIWLCSEHSLHSDNGPEIYELYFHILSHFSSFWDPILNNLHTYNFPQYMVIICRMYTYNEQREDKI